MAALEINKVLSIVPNLISIPYKNIWYSYDEEADVLYLNFKKPSHADDSQMTDDDVIIRYEKDEIIGITILNASKRGQKAAGIRKTGDELATREEIADNEFNEIIEK